MKLTSPIMLFVLASAGIHAGLVMLSNSNSITLPGSAGSVMEVKIKERQNPLEKRTTAKPAHKKISKKTEQQESSIKIKKTTSTSETIATLLQEKPASTATDKQQAESKARVISIIYKELSQHFIYPKLAQKRNWQGKVLLSLHVTSSGKINNVQLNSSSGYSILDQAAINSLVKVGNLPQISSWLPYDIDLKLPVIYQLTEG